MKAYIVEEHILRDNIRILLNQAGAAAVYGVVKGDGYGLGLVPLSKILWDCGVRRFAVCEPEEAAALRNIFPEAEILMLRETQLEEELRTLMSVSAVLTVGSTETAACIARIVRETGIPCSCHLKVDTGMGRYGFLPGQEAEAAGLYAMPELSLQGIYTHFHSAYNDETATRAQFAAFQRFLEGLQNRGIDPGLRHCCNSSAFLKYPEMHLDGVRLGSAVLGRLSFQGDTGLIPVGWCEAPVELIREIPKGHTVGYSATWTAKRPTRIAVIGVGSYHGFVTPTREYPGSLKECILAILGSIRALLRPRRATVEIGGRQAPVLGFIGMVQTICDVTDIPCNPGDIARMEIKPLQVKGLPIIYR